MPSLRFPYARFLVTNPSRDPLGRAFVLRPIIPVRLHGPSGHIDAQALADTGSDDTILDHQYADAVGIDWKSGASYNITGISGEPVSVHFKSAAYEIGGHRLHVPIGFANLPFFKAILGQSGFFDRAIVHFDQGNNRVEVRF